MKVKMKVLTLIAGMLMLLSTNLFSQVTNAEAEAYFGKFMDRSEQAVEFRDILATKKQLKKLFNRKDAKVISEMYKEQLEEEFESPGSKEYEQVRIVNFSSEELKNGTGKAAGGMRKISPKVKPDVFFYEVTYYARENAKFGLSYKYFARVNEEWVFLPKPWRAFK